LKLEEIANFHTFDDKEVSSISLDQKKLYIIIVHLKCLLIQ